MTHPNSMASQRPHLQIPPHCGGGSFNIRTGGGAVTIQSTAFTLCERNARRQRKNRLDFPPQICPPQLIFTSLKWSPPFTSLIWPKTWELAALTLFFLTHLICNQILPVLILLSPTYYCCLVPASLIPHLGYWVYVMRAVVGLLGRRTRLCPAIQDDVEQFSKVVADCVLPLAQGSFHCSTLLLSSDVLAFANVI